MLGDGDSSFRDTSYRTEEKFWRESHQQRDYEALALPEWSV